MDNLGVNSKSNKKMPFRKRFSSHDFSEFIHNLNKSNKICFPLKPKENLKSKFVKMKSNLKISLPRLED